jgi:FixJ family two-component response regulator
VPTILVVDDDPSVRKSLTRVMAAAGYAVEAFASARELLTRESLGAPCCLILDVRMPGLTGLDLQKMLAGDGRRMPIVFITGHGDVSMGVKAMNAGASAFLTKPFDIETLLGAVGRAVAKSVSD